jgi:hypothetical protein
MISDNSVEMDIDKSEEIIHFFLWVSHGSNVGSVNKFYPIDTKFQSVILYSNPFRVITDRELEKLGNNPCGFITGTCPSIPIVNSNGKKNVFLPPLLFVNMADDTEIIKRYTGLYYMTIKMSEDPSKKPSNTRKMPMIHLDTLQYKNQICELVDSEKIFNHAELIEMYGDRSNITYSQIYKLVTDQCEKKGLNPENILMGIFSCQNRADPYVKDDDQSIYNLLPRFDDTKLSVAKIYDSPPNNYFISPTIIAFNKLPDDWNTLAGIEHQGCALNVLSYFGIIPKTDAAGKAVCLSLKGTSIFKIADFLNTHFTNSPGFAKNSINWPGFVIARYTIDNGLSFIVKFMNSIIQLNSALIFKMYVDSNYKEKDSHVGHTVAIFNYNNNLYYVDPQLEILQLINISFNLFDLYQTKWNYMDIIFTVSSTPSFDVPYDTTDNFLKTNANIRVISKPSDINYGGSKLNAKNKKNNKNNKTKNHKKMKKTIKHKMSRKRTNKIKKYYGGELENRASTDKLDEFEELMINIDKKYNTPTTLDRVIIKDI